MQTSDGGYAIAGYTTSFGAGNTDAWLVKTDWLGNMQWYRTYGAYTDVVEALVRTSDGGYALAGGARSFGAGPSDFWLIKTENPDSFSGVESGLAWIDSTANTVTLYRGATDTSWNYVRVRLWKPR